MAQFEVVISNMLASFFTIFLFLPFIIAKPDSIGHEKQNFGADDRYNLAYGDYNQQLAGTASMAMMNRFLLNRVPNTDPLQLQYTGLEKFQDVPVPGVPAGTKVPLCPDQKFVGQVASSQCSGFLIGPDIAVTSGHCQDADVCSKRWAAWVFDFVAKLDDNGQLIMPSSPFLASNIYFCMEVLERYDDSHSLELDYADYTIFRLDRVVENFRRPVPVAARFPTANTKIAVIGHPHGLTTIVAPGKVREEFIGERNFRTDADTFGGNSGSMVINFSTFEVVGVMALVGNGYVQAGNCASTFNCDLEKGCPVQGFNIVSKAVFFYPRLKNWIASYALAAGLPEPKMPTDRPNIFTMLPFVTLSTATPVPMAPIPINPLSYVNKCIDEKMLCLCAVPALEKFGWCSIDALNCENVSGIYGAVCIGSDGKIVPLPVAPPTPAIPPPIPTPTPVAPPPVDCAGFWSEYTPCSVSCENGKQIRTFTIITNASNGGRVCPFAHNQQDTRTCTMAELCPSTIVELGHFADKCDSGQCLCAVRGSEANGWCSLDAKVCQDTSGQFGAICIPKPAPPLIPDIPIYNDLPYHELAKRCLDGQCLCAMPNIQKLGWCSNSIEQCAIISGKFGALCYGKNQQNSASEPTPVSPPPTPSTTSVDPNLLQNKRFIQCVQIAGASYGIVNGKYTYKTSTDKVMNYIVDNCASPNTCSQVPSLVFITRAQYTWDAYWEIRVDGVAVYRTQSWILSSWSWVGTINQSGGDAMMPHIYPCDGSHTVVSPTPFVQSTPTPVIIVPSPVPAPVIAVNGGFSQWTRCSASCENGTQQRFCNSPVPQNGGLSCIGEYARACNEGECPSEVPQRIMTCKDFVGCLPLEQLMENADEKICAGATICYRYECCVLQPWIAPSPVPTPVVVNSPTPNTSGLIYPPCLSVQGAGNTFVNQMYKLAPKDVIIPSILQGYIVWVGEKNSDARIGYGQLSTETEGTGLRWFLLVLNEPVYANAGYFYTNSWVGASGYGTNPPPVVNTMSVTSAGICPAYQPIKSPTPIATSGFEPSSIAGFQMYPDLPLCIQIETTMPGLELLNTNFQRVKPPIDRPFLVVYIPFSDVGKLSNPSFDTVSARRRLFETKRRLHQVTGLPPAAPESLVHLENRVVDATNAWYIYGGNYPYFYNPTDLFSGSWYPDASIYESTEPGITKEAVAITSRAIPCPTIQSPT